MAAVQGGEQTIKFFLFVVESGSRGLRIGVSSEPLEHIPELLQRLSEAEISDPALLVELIQQFAVEMIELPLSKPAPILNGNSFSAGSYAWYILPPVALAAMGYCFMRLKGWSFSDVMYVTKNNFDNAVAALSEKLENVLKSIDSAKTFLTEKLEGLDWKLDRQMEFSQDVLNDMTEVKSKLSQIGNRVENIHETVSGVEEKLQLVDSKQDKTNAGVKFLTDYVEDKISAEFSEKHYKIDPENNSPKGLQFIAETRNEVEKSVTNKKEAGPKTGIFKSFQSFGPPASAA